ncbi:MULTISPECIES: anti-sigma factor [Streptomyces]|uniref:Regulator of SigK n=1 Tax=Streptomyces melanosporofaciens TaxID=67327 RepID=A0A1H4VLX2_STRMJ|nr:anti-sigma factor [Streptomyces melanosporofaciens]SEC82017.1 Putative zinc-finger [Streptomyces melanosporofaciens]
MTRADLHTLTGAYAVHALSGRELTEFERHLAVCDACRQEVRELRETAGKLAVATALTPPPTMKDDVLRRIATVRQEPPRVAAREARESHAGPRRRTGRRALNVALAACVAAAVAFGGAAVWQYRQASDARDTARRSEQRVARAEEVTQVLAAPDARSRSGRMTDGSTGTVVVSRGLNRAVFLASGLPEPPAGRIYQLWFSDGGTMRPAGLMDSSGASAAAVLSGAVGKASAMGVTVEPAGGSKAPTTDPLVLLTFPSA